MGNSGMLKTQIPFGNDKQKNRQRQKQIPFGNDKRKNRQTKEQATTKADSLRE